MAHPPQSTPPQLADWIAIPNPERVPKPDAVTCLDSQETPVAEKGANLVPTTPEGLPGYQTCFRHRGWDHERRQRAKALRDAFGPSWALGSFMTCGCTSWILKSKTTPGAYRKVPDTCKSPWCKPCYKSRSFVVRARLGEHLNDEPVRFVTLTLRSNDESLRWNLDRLYRGFRNLRQRPIWKDRVDGGCAFLEVKIGRVSGQWHPHLHVMIQGRYIPKEQLQAEWLNCTGDSMIVDIQLVRSRDDVLNYVTKYVTKVADLSTSAELTCSPDAPVLKHGRLVEAMLALKGRRRIITFGRWRTWRLLRQEPMGDWEVYGHENDLHLWASDGDKLAIAILAKLERPTDDPSGIFFVPDTS